MDDERTELREQLAVKMVELWAFFAKKHGMGALDDLSPADYQKVKNITEKTLEIWEEAYRLGNPDTQRDETFNKLARERHELQKQIDATKP